MHSRLGGNDLASQNAAERAAHDRAADRIAHRAGDRLAETAGEVARDLVGDRTGDLARDQLTGREALAARAAGAEDGAEHAANLTEQAPALAALCLAGGGCLGALLQHLVGGFRIDRLIVFALHRALADDGLALVRRHRPDARRRRPYHAALH